MLISCSHEAAEEGLSSGTVKESYLRPLGSMVCTPHFTLQKKEGMDIKLFVDHKKPYPVKGELRFLRWCTYSGWEG